MGRALELIVLDGERPMDAWEQYHVHRLGEMLGCILTRTAGSGLPTMPLLAVASGPALRLFTDGQEQNLQKWSIELGRVRQCLASAETSPSPGILALRCVPAEVLSRLERLTFVTPLGGRSCEHSVVSGVLDHLSRAHCPASCEVELVLLVGEQQGGGRAHAIPTELIRLQSEHNLSATVLEDSLATASWASARIARDQSVVLDLHFGSDGQGTEIHALAAPALLHEEVVCDLRACMCHGAPLDGGRGGGLVKQAASHSRPRCPLSQLELDARDIQRVGTIGHFSWPSSLAEAASDAGVTCLFSQERPIGTARRMVLAVERRVKLSDLALSSVFGSPWLIEPPADAADESAADAGDVIGGLAAELEAAGEGLIFHCRRREHFEDEWRLPPNMRSLLQPRFILLPQTPPGSPLLLKSIATAAQILPRSASLTAETASDRARAQAASLLASTPLEHGFNPLFHCPAGGGTQVLKQLLSGTGAVELRSRPAAPSYAPAAAPFVPPHHPQRTSGFTSPSGAYGAAEQGWAPRNAPMGDQGAAALSYGQSYAPGSASQPPMQPPFGQARPGAVAPQHAGDGFGFGGVVGQCAASHGWIPGAPPQEQQMPGGGPSAGWGAQPQGMRVPFTGVRPGNVGVPPATQHKQKGGRRKMQRIMAIGGEAGQPPALGSDDE